MSDPASILVFGGARRTLIFSGAGGRSSGSGADGDNGWSPVLAVVTDGARRVHQIADWTGGDGTKPATGGYIGASGIVALISDAVDIRGAQGETGATGATGVTGPQGPAGADGDAADIAAEIHAATADSLADADEQGFWQSASSALRKITWANVKAAIKAYADTLYAAITHNHAASAIDSGTLDAARLPAPTTTALGGVKRNTGSAGQFVTGIDTDGSLLRDTPTGGGLTEPLTVARWTRQSSALSAAASGETKLQMRDAARYPLPELLTDVGDPLLLFPSLADPLVSGWWVLNSTTTAFKGRYTIADVAVTTSASSLGENIPALNYLTSASANAYAGAYVTTNGFRDGSATGNGYLIWGIFTTPDAGYGSGSTGAVINVGMDQAGGATNGNRPSNRCALLQYNTNQSDTNWQLVVHNGTSNTIADTGCAFAAGGTWLWMIHSPRGGSSTYAYIKNLETGASGTATVAATSGSTALYLMPAWVCTLSAVARNVRFVSAYLRAGGAN